MGEEYEIMSLLLNLIDLKCQNACHWNGPDKFRTGHQVEVALENEYKMEFRKLLLL